MKLSGWLAGVAVLFGGPCFGGEVPGMGRPPIIGLSHLTLQVSDLGATREHYHALLGFDEAFTLEPEAGDGATVIFRINDRQYFEFIAGLPSSGEDTKAHLAYEVTDAEGMRTYLAAKGVSVPAQAFRDRLGNLAFTVRDPEDRLVEFVQYLPDSRLLRSQGSPRPARQLSVRAFHAAIPVTDLEASLRFYQGLLGFSEILRSHTDQAPVWINFRLPEAAVYLEWSLMEKTAPLSERSRKYHVGLAVADVQEVCEILRERGAVPGKTVDALPYLGRNQRWHLGVYDPDGRRNELMEPFTAR